MDGSRARWHADLRRATPSATAASDRDIDAVFDDIARRYSEPHRAYHTLTHIEAVLRSVDDLLDDRPAAGLDAGGRSAIVLAAWLHDVVYDPARHDNEAASAAYAREVLPTLAVPAPVVADVARLIELTAGHDVDPDDRSGQILVDADLAILGAPWPVYAEYARHIRFEYRHVPDDHFRSGRAQVLEGFLTRPRLFLTDRFHARFDRDARANLRREITQLRAAEASS